MSALSCRCSMAALVVAALVCSVADKERPRVALTPPLDGIDQTNEELEHCRQAFLRRQAAKQQAVQELIAGRLTLLAAAAQFREAEQAVPGACPPCRPAGDEPVDGERLCRDVIRRVQLWLATHEPGRTAGVTARLEADLETHRAPDGTVRLPD